MKRQLRIVFFGTPDFASASLEAVLDAGENVVAVVTAPDKPQGRGKQLGMSSVKKLAMKYELPILQPTNLKSDQFQKDLRSFNADLQIVVAFRMLPESVWDMPPIGTFNLHASLLPNYRGAAPINWAIINGETETGVTTFFLKHEIDTGDILFQETETISPEDSAGALHDRLMMKGANLVVKTVQAISSKTYKLQSQSLNGTEKKAPKIFKDDCLVDWNQSAERIINLIRGLSPYPTAWTKLDNKTLKIFKARKSSLSTKSDPGAIDSDRKTYLRFSSNDGWVEMEEIQIEGKKRMKVDEFLRGYKLNNTSP